MRRSPDPVPTMNGPPVARCKRHIPSARTVAGFLPRHTRSVTRVALLISPFSRRVRSIKAVITRDGCMAGSPGSAAWWEVGGRPGANCASQPEKQQTGKKGHSFRTVLPCLSNLEGPILVKPSSCPCQQVDCGWLRRLANLNRAASSTLN